MSSITAVICHYNPARKSYLRNLIGLCVDSILGGDTTGLDIFVCDGSPEPDPFLANKYAGHETVTYLHGGEQLSFGATYNLGVRHATSDHVVLIANDIMISAEQIKQVVSNLKGDVGCVIPFLTESDYATQARKPGRHPRTCYPSSMTFNVNAFRREEFLEIGCVPVEMTGAYNDIVVFHRLRQRGQRIMLTHVGKVVHIGRVTRRAYSETQRNLSDRKAAQLLAPVVFHKTKDGMHRNHWAHIFANNAQTKAAGLLWRVVAIMPKTIKQQRGLGYWASWVEPYLSTSAGSYIRGAVGTVTKRKAKNT